MPTEPKPKNPRISAAMKGNKNGVGGPGGNGGPEKYVAQFAHIARRLCQAGLTDHDLAEAFGVRVRTIYKWAAEYPAFKAAIKLGREGPDDRVVGSLYHRAVGYTHPAVKIFFRPGDKKPTHVPYMEHHPPEVGAIKFWLQNRRPEEWREKREITVEDVTDPETLEQLAEMRRVLTALLDGGPGARAVDITPPKPKTGGALTAATLLEATEGSDDD